MSDDADNFQLTEIPSILLTTQFEIAGAMLEAYLFRVPFLCFSVSRVYPFITRISECRYRWKTARRSVFV